MPDAPPDRAPLLDHWNAYPDHADGVLVELALSDGRTVEFVADPVELEALADELRTVAHERFSRDDD
jgi:hypothetical protein